MRTHASTFAPFQTRERNYSRRVSKQLLRLDAAVQRLLAKPAGLPESAGWPEPAGLPETAGWPAPRGPPAAPFHQLDCAEPQPSTRSVSRGADGAALVVRGSHAPARDVGFLCPPPAAHEAAHIRDGCARGCGGGAGSSSLSRECGRGRGQGSESLRVCVRARGCGGGACSMNMNLRVPNCMNSVSSADRTPGISISFDCAMCRICFRITFSNSICGGEARDKGVRALLSSSTARAGLLALALRRLKLRLPLEQVILHLPPNHSLRRGAGVRAPAQTAPSPLPFSLAAGHGAACRTPWLA